MISRRPEFVSVKDMEVASVEQPIIQWYPGHVAAAEKKLQEHLSRVDVVFDVRDARILRSTQHPRIAQWTKGKRRFVLVNRSDMVSQKDQKLWRQHFQQAGQTVFFVNGQTGEGITHVKKAAAQVSESANASRSRRGLKPRPVRACVIGFPNIGKSALINRLLGRKAVASYKKPGVTKALQWVRMGDALDLLDSPGIIPSHLKDQRTATKLAICNDIGEAAYLNSAVAAEFLGLLRSLPSAKSLWPVVKKRYQFSVWAETAEDMLEELAERLFQGNVEQAGQRILTDYRNVRLGRFALEAPAEKVSGKR